MDLADRVSKIEAQQAVLYDYIYSLMAAQANYNKSADNARASNKQVAEINAEMNKKIMRILNQMLETFSTFKS